VETVAQFVHDHPTGDGWCVMGGRVAFMKTGNARLVADDVCLDRVDGGNE
jgi:hypothetical protein